MYIGNSAFTYADANHIQMVRANASGEKSAEFSFTTDDKKRALPVLPIQIAPDFSYAEVMGEGLFSSHNITHSALVYTQNRTSGHDYDANFTYNEGGYPVSCVKVFAEGSVEKITYVYATK